MTPVPNKAHSNAATRNCLFALDSSSWSWIFFSIFLAEIIAGWIVTSVAVPPVPSLSSVITGESFFSRPASLSRKSAEVSPGRSFISSGENSALAFCISVLVSKFTDSATPSGKVVGSIEIGNFVLPNSTSTI